MLAGRIYAVAVDVEVPEIGNVGTGYTA